MAVFLVFFWIDANRLLSGVGDVRCCYIVFGAYWDSVLALVSDFVGLLSQPRFGSCAETCSKEQRVAHKQLPPQTPSVVLTMVVLATCVATTWFRRLLKFSTNACQRLCGIAFATSFWHLRRNVLQGAESCT